MKMYPIIDRYDRLPVEKEVVSSNSFFNNDKDFYAFLAFLIVVYAIHKS